MMDVVSLEERQIIMSWYTFLRNQWSWALRGGYELSQGRGRAGTSWKRLTWTVAQSGGTWGMLRTQQRNQPTCTWMAYMKELQETRWIKRWGYPALRSDSHPEAVRHPTRARAFYKDWPGGDRWHRTGSGQAHKGGHCKSPARRCAKIGVHICPVHHSIYCEPPGQAQGWCSVDSEQMGMDT